MGSIEAEADAGLLKPTSELQAGCCCAPGACIACTTCGAELLACMGCQSRRCEHRYRRKWLYLRRACALPMRCGMRYALLAQRGVGAASCRCWCAPIECGPLMCLVCAGTVAAALERMAQPDATEWLYWLWCKPPIGYRQHGLGRELSQLQARSCRRCEHRYRRKWLYLRRACALCRRRRANR